MSADTTFFTFCLILGTLAGIVLRFFMPVEHRVAFYRTLTSWAIEVFLPIHVAGTFLKVGAATSNALELPLYLMSGGVVCMFAVLLSTYVIARVSKSRDTLLPHYPFIAATFAGGGRAVVLLAAAAPLIDQFLHNFLDPRLHGKGAVLDALAIFDTGYWAVYTAFVFPFLMSWAYASSKKRNLQPAGAASFGAALLVAFALIASLGQSYIVKWVSIEIIDQARFILAALIIIFSSTAVVLVAEFGPIRQPLRGIVFILLTRAVGLACVAAAVAALAPTVLGLLWLPMVVMLFAPPSSFIPQMLDQQGASERQRGEAAAINLAWNILLYATIGILAAVSALPHLTSLYIYSGGI